MLMIAKATIRLIEWVASSDMFGTRLKHWLEELVDRRFTDDSETDTGEGDTELGRRQVGVQMMDHPLRHAAPERVCVRSDLGRSDLHQRELGGDEEAVQADQEEGQRQAPADGKVEAYGWPRSPPAAPGIIRAQPEGRPEAAANVTRGAPLVLRCSGRGPGRVRPDWSRMAKESEASSFTRGKPSSRRPKITGCAGEYWVIRGITRASSGAGSGAGRGGRRPRSPRSTLPRAPFRASRAAARCAPRSGRGR